MNKDHYCLHDKGKLSVHADDTIECAHCGRVWMPYPINGQCKMCHHTTDIVAGSEPNYDIMHKPAPWCNACLKRAAKYLKTML